MREIRTTVWFRSPRRNSLTLEGLNFDYRLSGDSPDWKPVRVFDDGRQVFIQMPEDIATPASRAIARSLRAVRPASSSAG